MMKKHEESHENIKLENQNEYTDFHKIENINYISDKNFTPSLYNPSKIYSSTANFPQHYEKQNFIKFIKFLPNNKELLLITNDNKIQLLNFLEKDSASEEEQSKDSLYKSENNNNIQHQFVFQTKESNFIYDYDILYESNEFLQGNNNNSALKSNDYIKYFYICSKDNPVHAINSKGKFCSSYLTKNHVEEIINPISIKIDQYSLNLFCGFSKFFTIFDLATDKLLQKIELRDTNYIKESNKISCFDFHHSNKFYILGSYSGKIYSIDYLSNRTIFSIDGKHKNGITMLKFFNKSSMNFLSGGRRDNEILLWDFRNMATPLFSFFRENQTNQKLNFVLDDNDNFLYVANNDGSVIVYDLKYFNTVSYFYTGEAPDKYKEAVSCLDFNSNLNFLVTAHGSRHNFEFKNKNEETLDGDEINSDSEDLLSCNINKSSMRNNLDSGFKFWDFKNLSMGDVIK